MSVPFRRKFGVLICAVAIIGAAIACTSTAKAANAAPAATCAAPAWSGQYFSNQTLSGTPTLSRCDASINFNWGLGSPAASIPTYDFSARWTTTRTFVGGSYRFTTKADDGVRVKVDGVTIVNGWQDASGTTYNVKDTLTPGTHTVIVEYFEKTGAASISMTMVNTAADNPTLTTLVSTDDFSGTTVDSMWSVYNSASLAREPSLVSESGGMLKLQTQGLAGSGVCMCTSSSKPSKPYGRWEFRARMSAGAGNGGVIMLWPNAENWPVGGEIDMSEFSAATRQAEDFVLHYSAQNQQMLHTTAGDFTAWHTFSMEWTSTRIRYWVDGLLVVTVTSPAEIPTGAMHVVAQTGPHASATTSTARTELDIDWIKVYS